MQSPVVGCFLLLLLGSVALAQTPVSVRLVGPSGLSGTEGVVEVTMSDGSVGRYCDSGLDNNAPSVICAMLGYRGIVGYRIPTPIVTTGNTNFVIATTGGCPSFLPGSPSTWDLNTACSYVVRPNLPPTCYNRSNDVAVICTGRLTTGAPASTVTPNMATVAPTVCDSNVTNLRLEPGPTEGIVLIQNATGTNFGSVCAAGFGVNEATMFCRMLCQNATTNAIGMTGLYRTVALAYPVMLSGLSCPAGATSTNDCTHNGWGVASASCSQARAVTVRCAPVSLTAPPVPRPTVQCRNYQAFVYFSIADVPASWLLSLAGTYNAATCNFTVGQNGSNVWAIIPYMGCNSVQSTNTTHVTYTSSLYKNVTMVGGVYLDTPYVMQIVCAIPKASDVTAALVPDARTVPPVESGDSYTSEVRIFRDYMSGNFRNEITPGSRLVVGTKVYVRVQVTSPLNLRLVVNSCWATNRNDGTGSTYFLVKDKCASTGTTTIFQWDSKTVGIIFQVMSFTLIPSSTPIYVYSNVTICSEGDTSDTCDQVCGSAVGRRRRRDLSAQKLGESSAQTFNGPFRMEMPTEEELAAAAEKRKPAPAPGPEPVLATSTASVTLASKASAAFSVLLLYKLF
ncbi:hypothetical protein BOX15_Mlig024439g2 [Macrostomum lignano]|uniref:SRCR domain-containing protein n=2 Tax=Macrostomum lignano TaxID=282301 RepID=A0A1I8J6J8_9PLAT|nr:hypothetical protein BOX15_Mlig024439g2 [Macrostomum lignano]